MLVSTQTDILSRRFGQARAIEMLADAGYDAIDISLFSMESADDILNTDEYLGEAQRLRAVVDAKGIVCNQAHAPFPSSRGTEEYDVPMYAKILRSMEIASVIGARTIVVHPMCHLHYLENSEKLFDMNVEFYRSLEPYCRKWNIRVAVENMFQGDKNRRGVIVPSVCARPEEFCAMMDALNPEWFVACLDIGHAGLTGYDAAHCIRMLGHDRLHALHVHDNDYMRDMHTLPYCVSLDWKEITGALAEIRYDGDFTLEADCFLAPLPSALLQDAANYMQKVARYLADCVRNGMNPET